MSSAPIALRPWAQLEREIDDAEIGYLLGYLREKGMHAQAQAYGRALRLELVTLNDAVEQRPDEGATP